MITAVGQQHTALSLHLACAAVWAGAAAGAEAGAASRGAPPCSGLPELPLPPARNNAAASENTRKPAPSGFFVLCPLRQPHMQAAAAATSP